MVHIMMTPLDKLCMFARQRPQYCSKFYLTCSNRWAQTWGWIEVSSLDWCMLTSMIGIWRSCRIVISNWTRHISITNIQAAPTLWVFYHFRQNHEASCLVAFHFTCKESVPYQIIISIKKINSPKPIHIRPSIQVTQIFGLMEQSDYRNEVQCISLQKNVLLKWMYPLSTQLSCEVKITYTINLDLTSLILYLISVCVVKFFYQNFSLWSTCIVFSISHRVLQYI